MNFRTDEEFYAFCKQLRETEKALSTTVRINHEEVMNIVVNELIDRRNSPQCKPENRDALDHVLRVYYLTAEEFQKYVIDRDPIEL